MPCPPAQEDHHAGEAFGAGRERTNRGGRRPVDLACGHGVVGRSGRSGWSARGALAGDARRTQAPLAPRSRADAARPGGDGRRRRRLSGRSARAARSANVVRRCLLGRDRVAGAGRGRRRAARGGAGVWQLAGAPRRLILDLDATLVTAHSDKELAAGTYKHGFGFHPLLCYEATTKEALAGILRPGNAGANTACDHVEVLELALAQLPEPAKRPGLLVRADSG